MEMHGLTDMCSGEVEGDILPSSLCTYCGLEACLALRTDNQPGLGGSGDPENVSSALRILQLLTSTPLPLECRDEASRPSMVGKTLDEV